ncbi:hypothetical protein [Enterococcus hulanensis]|uniref:hypothetical protein n=1 Tax=Enterococcus hulanensis TaxID=2559929 RepID=UPI001A9222A5|nr:hypothetical protein [Enterococcus hulanensis]
MSFDMCSEKYRQIDGSRRKKREIPGLRQERRSQQKRQMNGEDDEKNNYWTAGVRYFGLGGLRWRR